MRSLSLYTAAAVLSCSHGIMVHHPEMDDPSKDYSCGRDWVSASIGCHKHCASGDDNDCADLGVGWGCYIFTGCSQWFDELKKEEEETSQDINSVATISTQNCGQTFIDAMLQCGRPCPRGTECDEGEECFGDTKCNYDLSELKSYIMIRLDGPSDKMDDITLDIFTGTISDMIRDYLADDLMMHLSSFDVIEQTRYIDIFDEYIDVKVTTTALYRLNLRRDFDNIIENIINLNQHEMKRLLKQIGSDERQEYFVDVNEIRARAIPITSSPSNSPSASPTSLPSELQYLSPSISISPSKIQSVPPSISMSPSKSPTDTPTLTLEPVTNSSMAPVSITNTSSNLFHSNDNTHSNSSTLTTPSLNMTSVVIKDDTRIPTRSPAALQSSKSGDSLLEAVSIMTEVPPQEEGKDKQPIIIGVIITVLSLFLLVTGLSILHLRKLRKSSRSKSDEVTVAAEPDTSNRSGEQRSPSVTRVRQSSRAGLSKSLTSDKPTPRHRQADRLAKSLPPEFKPVISASRRDVDWRSSQMRRTSRDDDIETGRRPMGIRVASTGVSKSFTTRDHTKRSLRHGPSNLFKSLPPRFELSIEDAGNIRTGRGEVRSLTTVGRVAPRKDRAASTNTTYDRLQTYPTRNPKALDSLRNNSRNATSMRRSGSHNKVTFEHDRDDEQIEWVFKSLRRSTSSKNVRSSYTNSKRAESTILRNSGSGKLSKSLTTERSNRKVDRHTRSVSPRATKRIRARRTANARAA